MVNGSPTTSISKSEVELQGHPVAQQRVPSLHLQLLFRSYQPITSFYPSPLVIKITWPVELYLHLLESLFQVGSFIWSLFVLAYQKLRQESLTEEYFSNLIKKSNEELTPLMPPFLLTVNFLEFLLVLPQQRNLIRQCLKLKQQLELSHFLSKKMPFQTFSEALLVTSYSLYHLLMFGGTIPYLKPFEAYFEAF
ncbi:hypothetical protein NC652_031059 [Populus alba x Populus x berolinensis]|nr:hypothetical protein NC652_031059 [Populus alba x Populus x berolinensis]